MNIGLVANRGFALWGSRRLLIRRLVEAGHNVHLFSVDDGYRDRLEAEGAVWHSVPIKRGGLQPLRDAPLVRELRRGYAMADLALVHHFHAKPMVFGSLAARWAGVERVVNTVTGLGESFPNHGVRRAGAVAAYRLAGDLADITVFQNSDDRALFLRERLVGTTSARLIVSSGVDTRRFVVRSQCDGIPEARVLFMSRLLRSKGIGEFVEAARIVRARVGTDVVFELAGEWDLSHPDAMDEATLSAINHDGAVRIVGYCSEPEKWLPEATAFVCPSYYREGVPRTVLEAGACGVPVVGVDAPGLRDVVLDGVTGFLVPPRDPEAIADRVIRLLAEAGMRDAMGAAARRQAEDRFDLAVVTGQYLQIYAALGVSPSHG